MALNIRLSPSLDSLARDYCDRVGISLNSLVGVALDAYLRQPEPARPVVGLDAVPAPVAAPAPAPAPVAVFDGRPKLKALRRVNPVLAAAPYISSSALSDPKPVLGPKPSKADRSKLAAWHKRNQ